MPKWDRELRIIDLYNAPCESALWPAAESETDAEILVAAHNADIDALTAERDEPQRRLDAVVAIVGLEQQGEFEDWPAGEHLRALRDVRAIAGRTE